MTCSKQMAELVIPCKGGARGFLQPRGTDDTHTLNNYKAGVAFHQPRLHTPQATSKDLLS